MTPALLLCGGCAGLALRRGGRRDDAPEISLGAVCALCELEHAIAPQATSAIVLEAAALVELRREASSRRETSPAPLEEAPEAIGPVTELAARFLAAWTESEAATSFQIRRAVDVARELLSLTGGR